MYDQSLSMENTLCIQGNREASQKWPRDMDTPTVLYTGGENGFASQVPRWCDDKLRPMIHSMWVTTGWCQGQSDVRCINGEWSPKGNDNHFSTLRWIIHAVQGFLLYDKFEHIQGRMAQLKRKFKPQYIWDKKRKQYCSTSESKTQGNVTFQIFQGLPRGWVAVSVPYHYKLCKQDQWV